MVQFKAEYFAEWYKKFKKGEFDLKVSQSYRPQR